jgi:Flp pilus assembly protein TadD
MHTDDAKHLTDQAIELLGEGRNADAERRVRDALRMDSSNGKALSTLAFALHAQGKHAESEAVYLRMTELEPQQAMHWMNVGTARRCDGRIDEALYAFARAATLGAASADFYYNVGLAHIARDDYESARAVLEKALRLNPEDAEIRYRYAFCCYETLRTDEALAVLEGWEQQMDISSEVSADGPPRRGGRRGTAGAAHLDSSPRAHQSHCRGTPAPRSAAGGSRSGAPGIGTQADAGAAGAPGG